MLKRACIFSGGVLGFGMSQMSGVPLSGAWGSTRIIYMPFRLTERQTIKQIAYLKGATIAGNVDLGIYDINNTRIVSSGSTAMSAGANVAQVIDITDTTIGPGVFMMAIVLDDATGTVIRMSPGYVNAQALGSRFEFGVYPLPVTASPARTTSGVLPVMALLTKTVF